MRLGIRDRVHKRHVHLHSFGNEILNLAKHGEVILGLDVVRVGGVEASN